MPAAKLIKIRKAVMRQSSKLRGVRVILTFAFLMAAITMPHEAWSQAAPLLDEWVVVIDAGHGGKAVSYTHLTLPTNREV